MSVKERGWAEVIEGEVRWRTKESKTRRGGAAFRARGLISRGGRCRD